MVAYLVQMVMEGTSCYRSLWIVSVVHDIGKEKGVIVSFLPCGRRSLSVIVWSLELPEPPHGGTDVLSAQFSCPSSAKGNA